MQDLTTMRTKHSTVITAVLMAFGISGCIALSGRQGNTNTTLVRAIELHGGKIEYHHGIGSEDSRVKAISLPAASLKKIDPMAFHVFSRLCVLHITDIPAGTSGETYETACCVNGEAELTKLVAEYRKAGLMP